MTFERLGATGLSVSRLCLGTMNFGDVTSEQEAVRIFGEAADAGVNFIDTADVNAHGRSEEIIGRTVRSDRDRWVIATKFGNQMGNDPAPHGLSRAWIATAVEASLRRLQIDAIDIYYMDIDDRRTPLDEPIAMLGDLIRAGKIRSWGFSNFSAWRIAEMVSIAEALGVPPPVAAQPCYNAVTRLAEVEYLPACAHFGVAVIPYSPLARGVLTAKYGAGERPADSRAARHDHRLMQTEFRKESFAVAEKIRAHAATRGMTPAQFAVAWVLNNATVKAVVTGPRTIEQWREYRGALNFQLDAADEEFVDSLVAPGTASTAGYNDPRYPITGRPLPT